MSDLVDNEKKKKSSYSLSPEEHGSHFNLSFGKIKLT